MHTSKVMGGQKLEELPDNIYFGNSFQLLVDKGGEIKRGDYMMQTKQIIDQKGKTLITYADIQAQQDEKCNIIHEQVRLSESLLRSK